MIIGIGCDIVGFERIENVLARHDEAFIERILAPEEYPLFNQRREKIQFLAGRWAAKEAASKALGTGIGAQASFREICIVNDERGAPSLHFTGVTAQTADSKGVSRIHITLSHDALHAIAMVVLEG